MILTKLNTVSDQDPILFGNERYPIVGDCISPVTIYEIFKYLKGFKVHWNCIEKAHIVSEFLTDSHVVIGSLMIVSGDYKSEYGYHYNPPYEFHAWVQLHNSIIDVALPGVIDKGLTTSDEFGPYLINREPVILAGTPLPWMKYVAKSIQS